MPWGALGRMFGCSWASWSAFGRLLSCLVLGRLWRGLGRQVGVKSDRRSTKSTPRPPKIEAKTFQNEVQKQHRIQNRSWCAASHCFGPPVLDFGPSWLPKMTPRQPQDDTFAPQSGPRGGQDGAQDDQKSIKKSSSKTSASWNDPKTILGRSWADLGPMLWPKWAPNHRKTYDFVNIDVFDKISS